MRRRSPRLTAVALVLALGGPGRGLATAHPGDGAISSPAVTLLAPRRLPPLTGRSWGAAGLPGDPGLTTPSAALEDARRGRGARPQEGRRRRPALVASIALAVTGAVIAYRYHDRAEGAYARYLRSAGPVRQQKALDQAEKDDRVAGAGFVVMELGLALTAWTVFF